jgi:hypothetical protein
MTGWESSAGTGTSYDLATAQFPAKARAFLFATAVRPAPGNAQPSTNCPDFKRSGHEADCSLDGAQRLRMCEVHMAYCLHGRLTMQNSLSNGNLIQKLLNVILRSGGKDKGTAAECCTRLTKRVGAPGLGTN